MSRYGWIALGVLLLLRSYLLAHPLVLGALLAFTIPVIDVLYQERRRHR